MAHQQAVIDIYNYYIKSGTSAFPPSEVSEQFYAGIMEKTEGYPAYALIDAENNHVAGFCFLKAYHPFLTFKSAATITYFIDREYTRKGLGGLCLSRLEEEGRRMGLRNLVAEVSSENNASINFHRKSGFELAGELKNIGTKLDRNFGVVYMQKCL